MLFDLTNLPYWMLLTAGVLLFLLVIGTGGGEDDLDVDGDVDLDLEIDADADFDLDVDAASAVESEFETGLDADAGAEFGAAQMLGWLGIGRAPLLLLLAIDLSTWGMAGWIANVLLGERLGVVPTGLLSGVILGGSFAIALATGSALSRPIGQIFASFGEDASSDRIVGCLGRVSSARLPSVRTQQIGQVDVFDRDRNLITISVCLPHWASIPAQRGDEVLIIEQVERGYLAVVKNSLDYEVWLNTCRDSEPA